MKLCRLAVLLAVLGAPGAGAAELSFRVQEIERGLGVGYAVVLVDIDGDGKKDIVVVDQRRVVWYQNPSWKRRTLTEGKTQPDNVCIAAHDVDGDGKVDFALGAGWGNLSSTVAGPLYWLRRGKTIDDPWEVFPIGAENSVHRIRFADVDGDGKAELVVAPLLGKGSKKEANFSDVPVRVLAFKVPKDPAKDRWTPEVLDESLHVMHNFWPVDRGLGRGDDLLLASYEGVHRLTRDGDKWVKHQLGTGNQDNPKSNRGSSEIKQGVIAALKPATYIATVEPWHGHQVVVYTVGLGRLWDRRVIDDRLKWGHGVWCADLDREPGDELIIGVRDNLSGKPGEKCGVRIYTAADTTGQKWQRQLVDEGGVAVEDLAAADLDDDGKTDIVAVGRQTKNVRIYWNQGKK